MKYRLLTKRCGCCNKEYCKEDLIKEQLFLYKMKSQKICYECRENLIDEITNFYLENGRKITYGDIKYISRIVSKEKREFPLYKI